MGKFFEYIGAKHTAHNQYGYRKDNVFYIIEKKEDMFKVEKVSEYSGNKTSSWKNLRRLKALIRTFDTKTEIGEDYLNT